MFVNIEGYIINVDYIVCVQPIAEREVEGQKEYYFQITLRDKILTISNLERDNVQFYYDRLSKFLLNAGMPNNNVNSNN